MHKDKMVDISIEVLASSVAIQSGHVTRYRVKTWWAHIDVPPNVTTVKLPRLPMIESYLVMTGKDTTMFLEMWHENCSSRNFVDSKFHSDTASTGQQSKFIGMTTCCVDEQLKDTKLNPTVQWLEVYDPIEDTVRGKVLLKVDAKFALTNSPEGKNDTSERDELPLKVVFSPRHRSAPKYSQDDYSPTKYSTVSSQISRKSDISLFSTTTSASIVSVASQEQGVQTDLSLPVFSGVSKLTSSALRKPSSSSINSMASHNDYHSSRDFKYHTKLSRNTSKSLSSTSSAIIDPLKYAEDILLKHSSSSNHRRTSEPVSSKPPLPSSANSSVIRRNCLIRQHQQQSEVGGGDPIRRETNRHPEKLDLNHVEDIIDLLNDGPDSVFSSPPTTSSKSTILNRHPKYKESEKFSEFENRNTNCSSSQQYHSQPDIERNKINPGGVTNNIDRTRALNSKETFPSSSYSVQNGPSDVIKIRNQRVLDDANNRDIDHNEVTQSNKFREVHFDGARAKEQATGILMTRTTLNTLPNADPPPSSNPPPITVTRRRIAAAIFND